MMSAPHFVFESTHPFELARIQAAAVYCSDGRFSEQVDDLLHNALKLPRYDRLAVPGGPACLSGHFATYREEEGVVEQLRFLMTAHQLERVVLIAHEDCAYYTQRLKVSPLQLEDRQRDDLAKAETRIRGFGRQIDIDVFFARKRKNRICFEAVGR